MDHDDEPEDAFDRPRTEIGVGMLMGGFSVGPVGGFAVGMHLDVGRQMGPLKVFGEYNFMSVGDEYTQDDPVRGLMHRGGVAARYNFATIGGGRYKPIRGSFWVEGGAGRELIRWNQGGKLTRDDLALGFGAQMDIKIGRHSPRPKTFSVYYAFKALVAESPGVDKMRPAVCGGPCDEPTQPSPYDLGLFFNLGLQWGR